MKDKVKREDKKWEFDEEVTACFDDMLARSIPDYANMRKLVFEVGKHFVQPSTAIVDLGSSRGNAIAEFIEYFEATNSYECIEVSKPMLDVLRNRFEPLPYAIDVKALDLRESFYNKVCHSSLIMSVLTLQFTPIEYRQRILSDVHKLLCTGGAFILVEKVLGNTFDIDDCYVDLYYDMKGDHGYTQEQIADKRKSLEGVLVPVSDKWNRDLLESTGFRVVDTFWRHLNFVAYLAIK